MFIIFSGFAGQTSTTWDYLGQVSRVSLAHNHPRHVQTVWSTLLSFKNNSSNYCHHLWLDKHCSSRSLLNATSLNIQISPCWTFSFAWPYKSTNERDVYISEKVLYFIEVFKKNKTQDQQVTRFLCFTILFGIWNECCDLIWNSISEILSSVSVTCSRLLNAPK